MQVHPVRSAYRLPWIVNFVFYTFKIIGLASVSLRQQIKTLATDSRAVSIPLFRFSIMGLFYNIALVIVVTITVTLNYLYSAPSAYYLNKSAVTNAMDIILDVLCDFTCCFIIAYWALRQEKAVDITNRLVKIHCFVSDSSKNRSPNYVQLKFFAGHMGFHTFLWIVALIGGGIFHHSILAVFVYIFPVFVIYWFVIEYSIVLDILVREIGGMNQSLFQLQSFPHYLFHTSLRINSKLASLRSLHDICIELFEVAQDVADFFSLPILFCISCLSLQLIYDIFYLIIPFVVPMTDYSPISSVNIVVWFVIAVYPISSLCFNVTAVTKQAKQTGLLVHKLLARERNEVIRTELEQFSLQLIYEDMRFTAYGFFTLDFTLLQSIFATTATYLVIIIQFMQSTDNKA